MCAAGSGAIAAHMHSHVVFLYIYVRSSCAHVTIVNKPLHGGAACRSISLIIMHRDLDEPNEPFPTNQPTHVEPCKQAQLTIPPRRCNSSIPAYWFSPPSTDPPWSTNVDKARLVPRAHSGGIMKQQQNVLRRLESKSVEDYRANEMPLLHTTSISRTSSIRSQLLRSPISATRSSHSGSFSRCSPVGALELLLYDLGAIELLSNGISNVRACAVAWARAHTPNTDQCANAMAAIKTMHVLGGIVQDIAHGVNGVCGDVC